MPPTEILTIQNPAHAARFGLSQWEVDYLLTRCFPNRWDGVNRVQGRIEVLVPHIQAGITRGSLDWWINGRTWDGRPIEASSNIITTQAGQLLEVIPAKHGPWTNGDVKNPTAASYETRARGGNPNIWSWTCEAEGQPWTAFTPEHWEAICWAFDDQLKQNPHLDPARDIVPHGAFNSVDRSQCGLYADKLRAELTGDHRPADRIGTVTTYSSAIPVKVTAAAGLNLRQWGELDSAIIGTMPAGTVVMVKGHVIGSTVEGINEWYIDLKGRRFWSGGTNRPNF